MLKSLYIKSFIIIDESIIDLENNMSVLTGETGAGKSIIIDAIGQLCGQRSSSSLVRKGDDKAIIEGVFDIDDNEKLMSLFDEFHIPFDNELILTKEIHANGKSTIKLNYRTITNNTLRLLSPFLLHIHSQYETQSIFNTANHLNLLDDFIGEDIKTLKEEYSVLFKKYTHICKEIKSIEEDELSDEQIEFYYSQYNEIKDFNYTDEDVENLENELSLLKNYELLNTHISSFNHLLNDRDGVIDNLNEALDNLDKVKEYNEFSKHYDDLYNHYYNIIDTHNAVMDLFNQYDFDEYRYNELQEELFNISKVIKKYGYNCNDVFNAKDELLEKINRATSRDEILIKLNKEKDSLYKDCILYADKLNDVRHKYGLEFEKLILKELKDLYLNTAIFKVDFKETSLNSNGKYDIIFMVAMNKGQSLTPLNETASGGEISRLMLSIKTIILKDSDVDTIIFDEVDTGVSGKVASAIGEKMLKLSKDKQVICITHLPQVAVFANHHFAIVKNDNNDKVVSTIKKLDNDMRIEEVAKMLSGDSITQEAISNAKRLLNI